MKHFVLIKAKHLHQTKLSSLKMCVAIYKTRAGTGKVFCPAQVSWKIYLKVLQILRNFTEKKLANIYEIC